MEQCPYELFETGATINEVRAIMGCGRNKCIKLLKEHFGLEKYKELGQQAKRLSSQRIGRANKGKPAKPRTEEWKRKISKGNKGKVRTKEHRENMSRGKLKLIEERGGWWVNDEAKARMIQNSVATKKKNGVYERLSEERKGIAPYEVTEEIRKKMSESRKAFYANGGKNWNEGIGHSEETKEKCRIATEQRWEDGVYDQSTGLWRSKLEESVFEFLSQSYECTHSYRVGRKVFDIYIPSLNLLIEVNGDYWHYNPELYDAEYYDKSRGMYVKDKWAKDKEKLVNAQAEGYNTIVLWEKNLLKAFESTITHTLQEFLCLNPLEVRSY